MRQTQAEFIRFLLGTLIPDLKGSGYDATAEDFEECVRYMRRSVDALREIYRAATGTFAERLEVASIARRALRAMGEQP